MKSLHATASVNVDAGSDAGRPPKRVLFVLPSLRSGGAETQTVQLIRQLDAGRFRKYLAVFEIGDDLKGRIDGDAVRFFQLRRRHRFDVAPARGIGRLIDALGIDIVHCSLQLALLMGWLGIHFARQRRPRQVLTLHTTINRDRKSELADRLLYQWIMRGCHRIICVCKAQEAHWHQKFPFLEGRTTVIHNGVDPHRFNPELMVEQGVSLRQRLGIPPKAFVVCCIAAFRPEKGHRILIDAFEKLLHVSNGAYLLLAGDGALRHKTEEMVRGRKDIAGNILFLGGVDDVRPILAASDVSVLASVAVETFSMVMLESLAMKVPMVATAMGGAAEALCDGPSGLLIPPGDPAALSERLSFMKAHPEERRAMGEAGRRSIVNRFNTARMVAETDRLLVETAAGA